MLAGYTHASMPFQTLTSVVSVPLRVFFDGQFNAALQRLDLVSERRHLFDLRAISVLPRCGWQRPAYLCAR